MATYEFTVTVECDSQAQAEAVMNERLAHEEELGFNYLIGWEPSGEVETCGACGRESLACSLNPCDAVLEDRGETRCDECGVAIPAEGSLVSASHERSCSLYDGNLT